MRSSRRVRIRSSLWLLVAGVVLLVASQPVLAQCPMCRTAAAAQAPEAAQAFNAGILILFVPAVVILGGTCMLTFRCRKAPVDRERPRRHEDGVSTE